MERGVLGRSLLAAACIAGAVVAASGSLGSWLTDYDGWVCRPGDYHVAEGEALLHGVASPIVSWSMPGFSVPDALLCNHASAALQMLARSLGLLAGLALVFALGCLLHCEVCGAASALLFALVMPPAMSSDRWLYTVHMLLVACALVWRAQAPDSRRSLLLGLTIGMSLLVLSPLFLLPPALALYEWSRCRTPDAAARAAWLRQMAGICLVPCACLLPWVLMNWRSHHRLILFEDGRASANIITGALGYVSTHLGGWGLITRDVPVDRGLLWWAAQEVWHHPFRYLASCADRLGYVFSFHPALLLSGLAAVLMYRKREEHRQLAVLAAYFIGIHCLLSVEIRYFEPLLPLLAALGASAALFWLKPAAGPRRARLVVGLATAVLVPLALLQLCAVGLVMAYPGRASGAEPWERELARYPQDPWLWAERGAGLMPHGWPDQTAADLAKALALAPQRPEWRMKYAWARMAQGRPGSELWDRLHLETTGDASLGVRWQAFRTIYFLRQGRRSAAQGALTLLDDIARLPAFRKESDVLRLREREHGTAGTSDTAGLRRSPVLLAGRRPPDTGGAATGVARREASGCGATWGALARGSHSGRGLRSTRGGAAGSAACATARAGSRADWPPGRVVSRSR